MKIIITALFAVLLVSPAGADTKSKVSASASARIVNGVVVSQTKSRTRTTVNTPNSQPRERSVFRSVERGPGGGVRIRTLIIDSLLGNSYTVVTKRAK